MSEPGASRPRRRALGARLLLPRLLTCLVLAGIGTYLGTRAIANHVEALARTHAETLAHGVGIALAQIPNESDFQRIVAAHGSEAGVERIVVVTGEPPRVIASTQLAWLGAPLAQLADPQLADRLARALAATEPLLKPDAMEARYRLVSPIAVGTPRQGATSPERAAVSIELAPEPLAPGMLRTAWLLIGGFVAVIVGVTVFYLWQLRHLVTRPLAHIMEALDRRAAGELDVRIPVEGDDEIGALAYTLNEMSETLNETDTRFRQVAAAIDDVFWLVDLDAEAKFRYVSPAYERVFGRTRSEEGATAMSFLAAVHPEDRARVYLLWVAASTEPSEIEFRVLAPDGGVRRMRSRTFPVLDTDGNAYRLAGVTTDVTLQREQEEALEVRARESRAALDNLRVTQERSRAILAAIPDVMLELTPDGIYVDYRAPRPEDFFLPPEKVLGHTVAEVVPAEHVDAVLQAMDESRRSGEVRPVEYAIRIGQNVQHYEARYSWCATGNCLVIVRDITERKEAEAAMGAAREAAEAASRAKSDFLANMSHEIRTPMNAVIGMTDLLLDGSLGEEQREYAEIIRSSGEALLTIINDILDFSKIEAGKLAIESRPFELAVVLEEVVGLLSERASSRGNRLSCQIDENVPPQLLGDLGRLRQVLLNLVGNAVKFTSDGDVRVHVSREPGDADPPRLRFEVQDTGPGIPEAVQQTLFRAFAQADASTTRRFGGTGLGLAISKRLTELMSGEIGLRSAPGAGSTFWFTLPLPLAKAEDVEASGAHRATRSTAPLGLHVLVAEDNAVNQRLAVALLNKLGCRADAVSNGRDAVEALEKRSYDVVLMDCQMPEMDGFEATRRIRASEGPGRNTPVVALTANAMQGDRERCLAAGMQDHVSKPVRIDDLRAALEPFAKRDA